VANIRAVNPLTLPPRLLLRALDDLHALALAARDLPAVEARLAERMDAVDARATELLALGTRMEQQVAEVVALGREILEQGRVVDRTGVAVAAAGREVAAGLPTLQRAVELSAPLEGAVERLGRFVDRLPGGGQRPRSDG
jgi:hypothetical protein